MALGEHMRERDKELLTESLNGVLTVMGGLEEADLTEDADYTMLYAVRTILNSLDATHSAQGSRRPQVATTNFETGSDWVIRGTGGYSLNGIIFASVGDGDNIHARKSGAMKALCGHIRVSYSGKEVNCAECSFLLSELLLEPEEEAMVPVSSESAKVCKVGSSLGARCYFATARLAGSGHVHIRKGGTSVPICNSNMVIRTGGHASPAKAMKEAGWGYTSESVDCPGCVRKARKQGLPISEEWLSSQSGPTNSQWEINATDPSNTRTEENIMAARTPYQFVCTYQPLPTVGEGQLVQQPAQIIAEGTLLATGTENAGQLAAREVKAGTDMERVTIWVGDPFVGR